MSGPRPEASGDADHAEAAWASGGAGIAPDRVTGLDYQVLLDAMAAGGLLSGEEGEDQDAVLAEVLDAVDEGRMGPPLPDWQLAAMAVEHMEPGPGMAGWLGVATAAAGRLDENGLAGVAVAAQKLVSWGQAAGLWAAAQIASRAAAADRRVGVGAGGRPARLCRDAVGQVELALMLSDHGAGAWADLAVTLGWRLPRTGAALAAGVIDLARARVIAEATSVLDERAARAVEARVLPRAGGLTVAQVRQRVRLAVIAADPEGAERRRQGAERGAGMRLFGEDDQTATIVLDKQPQIEAAAAFARVSALARARKAAGLPGSLGQHRSAVGLGLWLGTLPPIPPPGVPPPDVPPPDVPPPGDPRPGGPGPGGPGPGPGNGPAPDGSGNSLAPGGHGGEGRGRDGDVPAPETTDGCWDEVPVPGDEDAPPEDGLDDRAGGVEAGGGFDPAEADDDLDGPGPAPAWPALGVIPPGLARPARRPACPGVLAGRAERDGRPVPGLLDATVPWVTLAGAAQRPGLLGRIGPVTAAQARQLAAAAETDPGAQWRVIITNPAGQAITVARIRRRARRPGPGGRPPPGAGLVGRLTVTITAAAVREHARAGPPGGSRRPGPPGTGPPGTGPPGIIAAVVRAAAAALARADVQAAADAAAGGCAHASACAGYRPPPRLREHVTARDITCRNPVCRQPAWRADLDHTRPYDHGGPTCSCNLGGTCRRDHHLKQHPRWHLTQTSPGHFTWTTPAGRTYTTTPDTHPI